MITAVFTDNSDYARATGLWQWDYGQRLRIEGLHLPTAVEIHFALTEQSGDAITRVGTTKDGVTEVVIPDSLLENQAAGATYEIYAWIYLADNTSGETIKRISVQVKRRPKPEGFDAPEDAELFREAIEAVNASADRAEAAREEVERDRTEVSETHRLVEQLRGAVDTDRQAVAADRRAVENTALQFGQTAQSAINAVGQAQEAAVGAVSAEGQRQTTAVQNAGTQAVSDVGTAKAEAVQAVTTEGDTQTKRVQDAAAGIVADREQIAANKAGVESLQQNKADAIVETAQGETMTLTDSSDKLFRGLRVFGRSTQVKTTGAQLFDVTNVDMKTILNIDGTTNANGSIHTSGFIKVSPNTTYSVSKTRQNRGKFYNLEKKPLTTDKFDFELSNNGDKFTTSEKTEYVRFSIYETESLDNVMVNAGDTLKPWEPYSGGFPSPSPDWEQPILNAGEGGSVEIGVVGKNLINLNDVTYSNCKKVDDTTVMSQITNKYFSTITITTKNVLDIILNNKGKNAVFAIDKGIENKIISILIYGTFSNGKSLIEKSGPNSGNVVVLQIPHELQAITRIELRFNRSSATFTDTTTVIRELYLSVGAENLFSAYEPYTHQSLTLATPNGLPGVPVSKDGNYVDSNGQQWICDEIDLGRGKYVQRVSNLTFDGVTDGHKCVGTDGYKSNGFTNAYTHPIPNKKIYGAVLMNILTGRGSSGVGFISSSVIGLSFGNERCGIIETDSKIDIVNKVNAVIKEINDTGTEVIAYYELEIPIERDLTPEELAAYSSLHTNYPITVITNDAGAHMETSYVADTGTYIRNMEERLNAKLVNIQSALISQKISGGGIKVADSARVPVVQFAMWGKTEQVRTSGKNLIDIPEIKAETGSIIEVICNITRNAVFSCRKEDVVITKSIWRVQFKYKNGNSVYLTDDRISSGVVEATEDNPIVSIVYRGTHIESGRYTDIQLEYGSSPTAYEPYTGGRPSPSPDYPQPIETTDQPVTVTIKGGTEQQSITLTPPRPFTKWDKLEKVDGVWCWVYQHNEYTVTGEESFSTGDSQYTEGSSTDCFIQVLKDAPRKADGRMERLSAVDVVWSKLDAVGFCLNINQLHMRLPNFLLGVSDDAIASEKIAAYKAYVKAEYDKGTPYHVIYETTTPEPISLSPSEQGKLNAITMYAGTTEVTNTGGCNMELTYTVDTKSYVDSKIAAISAAVLEV